MPKGPQGQKRPADASPVAIRMTLTALLITAERANLTMRMAMRRFTRLANAFSKKLENHAHMVALYALWYNSSASIRGCGPAWQWRQELKSGYGRWGMWLR